MKEQKDKRATKTEPPGMRNGGGSGAERNGHQGSSTAKKAPAPDAASREAGSPGWRQSLRGRFQRFMTAAAFAESGETDTALEIAYAPTKVTRILLAVDGAMASNDAIHFAANLCLRMDAGLDVLLAVRSWSAKREDQINKEGRERGQQIQRLIRQFSGSVVPVRVLAVSGRLDEEVHSYAKSNKHVAVIVLDSGHSGEKEPERAKWESLLQKMSRKLAIPTITAVSKSPVGSG